jgi:hypothetical protein
MTIKLNAATGGGSVSLSAPNSTTSNLDVELTLPVDDGAADTFLKSDGSGTLSWAAASSDSITEGNTTVECVDTGSDGHITFDTEGSERARFDSDGRFLVNGTTSQLVTGGYAKIQVSGTSASGDAHISCWQYSDSADGAELILGSSRGSTVGSTTVVQNNDRLGRIRFGAGDGSDLTNRAAEIKVEIDGTPGDNDTPARIVFGTASESSASATERMRIDNAGRIKFANLYDNTSATGRTVLVQSTGELVASTSSIKYKTDVETLQDLYADAVLQIRPVWYKSLCTTDNPDWGWWGFIAEEVAEIDPRLVQWKESEVTHDKNGAAVVTELATPEPEGVYYERFVPHLVNLIKRQKEQLETQAASIASLEARLTALEGGAS